MNWRKPILFTLLYLSGSKVPEYLSEIKRVENLPDQQKESYQKEKLEKILLHAWKNVPYYTKVLTKTGVVKDNKVNLKNFHKIPILTKEIIRKEGKNLYSKDYQKRGFYKNTSGGSTGEPVEFIQDKEYDDWNNATKIYYKILGGQNIGEKELRLWGSERDLLEGKEKLTIRLRNFLYNRKESNSFKMTEMQMTKYAQIWNEFKPQWVEAYIQSIYEFGQFLDSHNLKVFPPRGILTSAGVLSEQVKDYLHNKFECKIFNRYGSREVGAICCSSGKTLEISFWHNYLEILDKNLQNIEREKIGNVYITTLNNYSMPLIRYQISDCAIMSGKFALKNIVGRETSLFKTKDGGLIDGEFFTHLFYFKNWCKKFQIVQKDYNYILIKLVINKKYIGDFKKEKILIMDSIKKVMGKNCNIKWQVVNEISPNKSGKYMYTISEI
jgi:phenylacetate-CoA ligase